METTVDEVAEDIYRISTVDAAFFGTGFTFNQFLIDADQPLLFSTGFPALFPRVAEAVDRVLPHRRVRWISSGHASRSDEFGSLNQWLAAAPGAEAAHGERACLSSLGTVADRPPRVLADGEVLDLGGKRVRYLDAPFAQGPWESGFLYEETTGTLFCGDLFAQAGRVPPITEEDIVAAALAFHDQLHFIPVVPSVLESLHRLADLHPLALAPMPGPRTGGMGRRRSMRWRQACGSSRTTRPKPAKRSGKGHRHEEGVMSAFEVTTTTGSRIVGTATVSEEVRASFSGSLVEPGDDGYEEARRVHNGLIDKRPALIARCLTTADVVDAVNLGREQGLEISVRGGGHNVAGKAVTDGGLMIDLGPMKGVHVDPRTHTIRAQPGLTWREFNRAAAVHGLATTGGVVSTAGIAGLTLGGGFGYLMGRYGLAIDNLASAEVVTAEGQVRTAGADENEDLFWALRGGGGNFGVVTSFQYSAHPLATVLGGMLVHPLPAARSVLDFYRQFTGGAPDELGVNCGLVHAPDGSGAKIVALPLCHAAEDLGQAEADLKPLREFGPPDMDTVQPMPYPAVNTMLDDGFPRGALNYWKSAFLTELSDAPVRIIVDAFEQAPSTTSCIILEHLHGEATRVDPAATAFPHRQPGYSVLVLAQWADPADTQTNVAWARETFEALRPHLADRRYMNYMSADDGGFVRQAYGPNYDRLVEIKRRYDPQNLFRLNQNILPTPTAE
jgi:FAD/FMN-containing dehydrogenase